MKNLSVILVAFALLFGTSISTAAVVTKKGGKSVSQEIGKLLKNPKFLVEGDMNADVTFTINSENEIVVLTVDTQNDFVERFIKSRLNYKQLENELVEGKEYNVPVKILMDV